MQHDGPFPSLLQQNTERETTRVKYVPCCSSWYTNTATSALTINAMLKDIYHHSEYVPGRTELLSYQNKQEGVVKISSHIINPCILIGSAASDLYL